MQLGPEEMRLLLELSEPLEQSRRPAFLQEATRRIEAAAPQNGVGPGFVHRVGRVVQRDYFDPPDLRVSRVGPRG
jgi:hypothetical protein